MSHFKLHYGGSVGWLIFWMIVFFPVALVLIATGARFEIDRKTYSIRYDGSRNWLCFWAIVFFPVVLLLGLLNGFSVVTEE